MAMRLQRIGTANAAALLVLAMLGACSTTPAPEPPPAAAAAPSVLAPPPLDLGGRWRLTAAAGGACSMTFGDAPGATQGTIAPEGGCPGNFFTSRKWTFERDTLIVRDHKGEPLAQLTFTGGHFEGKDNGGGTLSLSR